MSLQIITTGGTIAKRYDEIAGTLTFDPDHLEKILEQGRCLSVTDVVHLMLKDSLEMTVADRELIARQAYASIYDRIVITHGTDTMVETAGTIQKTVTEKTVVLTGAMIPFAFKNSDALFNVGTAIAAAQALKKGIYIVMNGTLFSPDEAFKLKEKGIFVKKGQAQR